MILDMLIYVPGAMEAFFFLIFFAAIAIYRRKFNWEITARAVRAVTIFCLMFSAILTWSGIFKPMQWVLYFAVAVMAHVLIKKQKPIWALPMAIALFAFTFWQFTFVEKNQVVAAEWEIVKKGPGDADLEQLVTFRLSPTESTSIYSNEVATMMKNRKDPKVPVTMELLYHWGSFAGHSITEVDGKPIKNYDGFGSVGCTEVCSPYYFGLRGFKFN